MENDKQVASDQEENFPFKIAPLQKPLQQTRQFTGTAYLHHSISGPNQNQSVVVNPNLPYSFGTVTVNDWPVYDSLGAGANLVARAQGMHVQAAMSYNQIWYNSFSIVFENYRFRGSTLQVMGIGVEFPSPGEWAIVGGTGQFTLAQGVIYKNKVTSTGGTDIIELRINAYYSPVYTESETKSAPAP
ncbi:dirigent protein 22-like [Carex rostrata]